MLAFHRHFLRIALILASALGSFTPAPGPARAQMPDSMNSSAPAACAAAWQVVASPNGSGADNSLDGLAVISASDIWAVGSTGAGANPLSTLAEHWNGSAWSVVASPNGSFAVNRLSGVDAVASNDVWAVGYSDNGSVSNNRSRTLILHWTGSNWAVTPSPNTTRPVNRLSGVVAISANDVWAVGQAYDYSTIISLVLHWNGASWSIVPSPNPGSSFTVLYGIDALATNNVWAVGSEQNTLEQNYLAHWDGASWSKVTSPQVGPYGNLLLDVFTRAADDIWAVGYHLTVVGFNEPNQTSILHYDGTTWSVVPSPNVNQNNNYLFDVTSLAANDAWAVGLYDTGFALNTMIQHWDGARWTIRTSPNPGVSVNELHAVEAVSASNIWAVGFSDGGEFGVNTLVEHYSSACPNTLHVAGITPSFKARAGSFQVQGAVTIQDAGNAAVSAANVTVRITEPDAAVVTRAATTNASGQAVVAVTSTQTGTYTFTVTNVAKTGFTYDPAANVETSDSITVQ